MVLILILALSGMYFGYSLTKLHYYLLSPDYDGTPSNCNVSEIFNCDAVNTSSYSEMFGIPIAFLGLITYTLVFLMTFIAVFGKDLRKVMLRYVFVIGCFSVLYSIFLFYICKFVLGVFCLYCVFMYGINFGIFLFSWLTYGKNVFKDTWNDFRTCPAVMKTPGLWLATIILILIVIIMWIVFFILKPVY